MNRWWIVGIGAAVIAAMVLYFFWSQPNRGSQNEQAKSLNGAVGSSVYDDDGPMNNKALSSSRENPKAPIQSTQHKPGHQGNEPKETSAVDEPHVKPPEAQGPLRVLKRRYQDESRDLSATPLERRIREQFDPEYFPMEHLYGINCHTSVCKVDVQWSEEYPMVLAAVAMAAGKLMTSHIAFDPVSEPDRNGNVMFEVYILRSGYDLPDPE